MTGDYRKFIDAKNVRVAKKGRRFIGIELKPSYFEAAVRNLRVAEEESRQMSFDDYLRVTA